MELVDALSSNTDARHFVELSLNPHYRRNYCSLTRSLDEYYQACPDQASRQAKDRKLTQLLTEAIEPLNNRPYDLYGVDATPMPRPHAACLSDRSMVHQPTVVKGNKPVTIGHQYSIAAYLPEKKDSSAPAWVLPLSAKRVQSHEKSSLFGIKQSMECIELRAARSNQLSVLVADSAYSTPHCIVQANKNPNMVLVSRVRNNRNFYRMAEESKDKKRGRKKRYDNKFDLKDQCTWGTPDDERVIESCTKKEKSIQVVIKRWNNLLMRGRKEAKTENLPFDLVKIEYRKPCGELLFKRPLFLLITGERKSEVSTQNSYESYRQRFDLEHFFRFGKNRLVMDKIQTPDTEHEEAFMQYMLLAAAQLYLARKLGINLPKPWEKHLPEFKSQEEETDKEYSPTQTQRSFTSIIGEIGTPAQPPKPRKKAKGRKKGDRPKKRERYKVVVKEKKQKKEKQKKE